MIDFGALNLGVSLILTLLIFISDFNFILIQISMKKSFIISGPGL